MQHDSSPLLIDEPIFSSATQKFILLVALSLSLVMGGWFLWSSFLSNQEDQVHQAYLNAKTTLEKRKVADLHPSTQQAALIYLDLANGVLDEKPQEAIDLYDSFLKRDAKHLLVNSARLGKAKALESLQKSPEAIALYQEIILSKPNDAYVPLAFLNLSRIQIAQGKLTEARQSLQELLANYPDYAMEAKERLKSLPEQKS